MIKEIYRIMLLDLLNKGSEILLPCIIVFLILWGIYSYIRHQQKLAEPEKQDDVEEL